MREHLYRGKDRETGKWVFGSLLSWDAGERHICCEDDNEAMEKFPVIPETVGEYTGLKDKNGVKIFEGDIVKSEVSIGDVQFSHGMFGIEWRRAKADKSMVGSWGQLHNLRRMDDGFNKGVEVIGNCFDNPELLECKSAGN